MLTCVLADTKGAKGDTSGSVLMHNLAIAMAVIMTLIIRGILTIALHCCRNRQEYYHHDNNFT
jgi:hypothetical protein